MRHHQDAIPKVMGQKAMQFSRQILAASLMRNG
jgi:hypothetical protein